MGENKTNTKSTSRAIELTEVRPPLSEIESKKIDSMLRRYVKRHPNSDLYQMCESEKQLFMQHAEFFGFARTQWVLRELLFRPGAPTTETVMEELDALVEREQEALDPRELERETRIVDSVCRALSEGKFKNMDGFFEGREALDNLRIRFRVWNILLL
jgi:hypothetical protein